MSTDGLGCVASEVVSKSASEGLGLVCVAGWALNLSGGIVGLGVAATGTLNPGLLFEWTGELNLVNEGLGLGVTLGGVLNLKDSDGLGLGCGGAAGGLNLEGPATTGELNLDAREPLDDGGVVNLVRGLAAEEAEEPGLEASGVLNLDAKPALGLGGDGAELKRVAWDPPDLLLGVMPGELIGVFDSLLMVAPGKGRIGRFTRSARSCNKSVGHSYNESRRI